MRHALAYIVSLALVTLACSRPSHICPEADAARPLQKRAAKRTAPPPLDPTVAKAAGTAVQTFALELLRETAGDGRLWGKSFAMAPLSLARVLAVVHPGARGETQAEIGRALHLGDDVSPETIMHLEQLPADGAPSSAALFTRRFDLDPAYAAKVRPWVSTIAPLPDDVEAGRLQVNEWASAKTSRRVTELLPGGSINQRTRLVLADAFFADLKWKEPLEDIKVPVPFTRWDGSIVRVPGLEGKVRLPHAIDGRFKALELTCDDDVHALLLVQPYYEHQPLDGLEKGLPAFFNEITSKLREGELRVTLPRFSLASGGSLVRRLRALGVQRAFSSREGDLSGIGTAEGLTIDDVVQSTTIDVTAKGVAVAGATGAMFEEVAGEDGMSFFRPFFFVLRNTRTNAILLIGRYSGP